MKLGDEMNTIDELLYYCRESEPVGAVLLSGEWGCGKTYLVDHELKAILDGEAVILRISLFGITRPEEIHDAVKSAWMETYYRIKGLDSIVKNVKKFKRVVETAQILPEPLKGILATDPADFFSAKNKIDDKYVVLVFDDLERCQMNSVDVLGIINDYCENGQYHTIIVANQEKIVQRTVQYIPDYKKIVHTVITSMKYENSEYKAFIESCESGSIALRHIPSRIKLLRIMDIDDSVLQDGFSDFLVMAYSGNLTLEEYVRLVENSCWARKYQCPLPESIDWSKVNTGVDLVIGKIKETLPEGQILHLFIDKKQREYFTNDEWSTYERIAQFSFGNELMFLKNRKLYIDKMNELGVDAFLFVQNKRFDLFDEEMARVTALAFTREHNMGKDQFRWMIEIQFHCYPSDRWRSLVLLMHDSSNA